MSLSQSEAQYRATLIQLNTISYQFHLFLQPGDTYTTMSKIKFTLIKSPLPDQPLFLDCVANSGIDHLWINESPIDKDKIKYNSEKGKIYLNSEHLKERQNSLLISYVNKYDNDGTGLVSFIDVDEKQYLYTQFEPYHANQVVACFDQPDLKAKMELVVVCPKYWKRALSNEYQVLKQTFNCEKLVEFLKQKESKPILEYYKSIEEAIKEKEDEWQMIVFPETKLLPTYLYCLIVGYYEEIALPENQRYNNIPMSLYSIQSLFPFLEKIAPMIFETTIECMKFYQQFFGVPYSFNKYDQAFVHDFKSCAMENAGIVTFNDNYVYQQEVSEEQVLDLANSITHELAHHWFGNLVTMKWWDDLWLNESFAEFISYLALEKIQSNLKLIKFESSMATFFGRKTWGYDDDQAITTHPIRGPVPNTSAADSIFDGITYAKGAATMKQLLLLMGEQNYSAALKDYFTKYPFQNATLSDFVASLQKYFTFKDFDLNLWKQLWLETASLNNLQALWNQNSQNQSDRLIIKQTPYTQKYQTLRPHKLKIAFFKQDCSYDIKEVLIEAKPTTQIIYQPNDQYRAVMLNYEDHTFAKVILDTRSKIFFSENITKISDILTRTLLWRNFYDLVKSANISSLQYITIFLSNIKNQVSDSILQRHYEYVHNAIQLYTPQAYRQEFQQRVFYFTKQFINEQNGKQTPNKNRLVVLKQNLIRYATTFLSIRMLYQMLEENPEQFGVKLQWEIVVKQHMLPELSIENKIKLLNIQLQRDNSDTAKQEKETINALMANQEQLQKLYMSYIDPKNSLSVSMKKKSMRGWNYSVQHLKSANLRLKFKERYFTDLQQVSTQLQGDHFFCFLVFVDTLDDNFEENINRFKTIQLKGDKLEKSRKKIRRIMDDMDHRTMAHKLFSAF